MADLPTIIPVFPLPNLVLFPGVRLPLHIFEPRYREMISDVASGHGIIGMILLKGDWEKDYHGQPDIFEVGCAGRLESVARLPDGRFNVILNALDEFRVTRELRDKSYRRAEVQWCPVASDALATDTAMLASMRDLLARYLGEAAEAAWKSLVKERGLRGADLVNLLCFHLDITPIEKQTLLEAFENRVGCLLDILTFKLEEQKLGPYSSGGPSRPVQ